MYVFTYAKVDIKEMNPVMLDSMKSLFSFYGLFMLLAPVVIGGGLLTFFMQSVTMDMVGYVILQPVILSVYSMMLLTRYKMGEPSLGFWRELRNILITILLGPLMTVILIILLWGLRSYISSVYASDIIPDAVTVEVPTSLKAGPISTNGILGIFPIYFNMFSLAAFSTFLGMPMLLMFLPAIVRCNASLFKNIGIILKAIFRNFGIMIIVSILAIFLLSVWSYFSLRYEWVILTSTVSIAFLSGVLYRITVLALPHQ
ncbi:hypothetical protein BA1DRAFT_03603 [Photorhabdus aegyptia]|uniref:Uncharacterized protein n=2 Tax=Photorhabdus TaxID=29487 RepID=A0A022PG39_9GAMM|nr:hypothetical protein BA1DRAFT_03603 [Photorhabdus aegyptia]